MGKPITFEVFNLLDCEAVTALDNLEALFRGFLDAEGNHTEPLCFVGMSLCRDGRAQIHKVWEDWKAGKYDEKDTGGNGRKSPTQNEENQKTIAFNQRFQLMRLTEQIPDDKLEMIVQCVSTLLKEPQEAQGV